LPLNYCKKHRDTDFYKILRLDQRSPNICFKPNLTINAVAFCSNIEYCYVAVSAEYQELPIKAVA